MKIVKPLAVVALLATGTALAAGGWTALGSQGVRHFVALDAAQAGNTQAMRDAAAALCAADKPCIVLFWNERQSAAVKMPMSAAQTRAVVAQFTRNPASGHEELLLRCAPGKSGQARCLK